MKLEDGTEIIKVKGLSHKANINFNDLKSLLQKDQSLVLNQVKSLRDITESNINLVNQTYELIPTENKRQLVYDHNGLMIGTKPYVITPDKIITTNKK